MMSGIRITPTKAALAQAGFASAANRPWCVIDGSRPLVPAVPCFICGKHEHKTYHLGQRRNANGVPILDADGTVMVTPYIWQRFQMLHDNAGFEKVNVVSKPPTQTLILPPALARLQPANFGGTT